ncbi:hypothetical protein Shyhy02_32270 [Streptomyces hygroscopicus subsp. hygroscopicus]|nr:hypothetical protein Shyhy02_32270 [Streptomyces hygroscopicus subsp. hygroscopicus]
MRKSWGRPTGRDHRNAELRGEGVGLRLQALAAAAKKKQPETHDGKQPNRDGRDTADPYHYTDRDMPHPDRRVGLTRPSACASHGPPRGPHADRHMCLMRTGACFAEEYASSTRFQQS